jgi:hypothetical protein
LVWILPLGVFIAPSKEKAFCGGQRAICMCSHQMAKRSSAPAAGESFSKAGDAKEEGSAGFSSSHYDQTAISAQSAATASLYCSRQSPLYRLTVVRPVEHVPKA